MGSEIEPNGDFVEKWLYARKKEGDLDQYILDLIQRHSNTNGNLDEDHFLDSLLSYSDKLGGSNDSD